MLSRMSGIKDFEEKARKALIRLHSLRTDKGLVGGLVMIKSEKWMDATSTIGAGSDSFYEYLLKVNILLSS